MEKVINKNIMKKINGEMERNWKDEKKEAYGEWQ